jgi:hypothetical protein
MTVDRRVSALAFGSSAAALGSRLDRGEAEHVQ